MSHFVRLKTSVKSESVLRKALTRMGLAFEEGNFTITQYGTSDKAEFLLDKKNKSVGLSKQKDGTYSMVGDFYHAPQGSKLSGYYGSTGNKKFQADLATAYSVEEAFLQMQEQGYYCSENEEATTGKDGKIRMVFTSYS